MSRFDKYWLGILIGLLVPALFMYSYASRFGLLQGLHALSFAANPIYVKMCIVAMFPDMALLFLFYEMDVWRLSKGVLIGSFPYILLAIWFCF